MRALLWEPRARSGLRILTRWVHYFPPSLRVTYSLGQRPGKQGPPSYRCCRKTAGTQPPHPKGAGLAAGSAQGLRGGKARRAGAGEMTESSSRRRFSAGLARGRPRRTAPCWKAPSVAGSGSGTGATPTAAPPHPPRTAASPAQQFPSPPVP